jgi:hypothetical protein
MGSLKQLKHEEKAAALQRQVILELNEIARDIERSEKIILKLNQDLQSVNAKLAWEKQISSLQKRTPALMERMSAVMHDEQAPPSAEVRDQMLHALQAIQAAMERLQSANSAGPGSTESSGGKP